MDVRKRRIHPVPFDRTGNAADKNDGPVRILPFHNTDMGQRVIDDAVSIVIPGIVEEDEIAGTHHRSFVKSAIAIDVVVDEPHSVGFGVGRITVVEVDAVLQINRSGDAGAIIRNPFAIGLNRPGPHQFGCSAYDGSSSGGYFDGSAAGLSYRRRPLCPVIRRRGTTYERGDSHEKSDQKHAGDGGGGSVHVTRISPAKLP